MDEMPPDPFAPPRPAWVTLALVSLGAVCAPLGVLGFALLATTMGLDEGPAVAVGFAGMAVVAVGVFAVRLVRPLGTGFLVGAAVTVGILALAVSRAN